MKFAVAFSALLTAAVANPLAPGIPPPPKVHLQPLSTACVEGVHVIAVPGQSTTHGNPGYLATLIHNITSTMPKSNWAQISYPKGYLGPQDIEFAVPALHKHLNDYTKRCPRTKIVIASYSVGGAAAMDTICGSAQTGAGQLAKHFFPNILATIVYGDLTFVPGKKYNRGTCTAGQGVVPRAKPGKCFPFGQKIESYCDVNDPNCCSGNDLAVHFSYPGKYDLVATQYVVKRWNRFQKNLKSGRIVFKNGHYRQTWHKKHHKHGHHN